MQRALQLVLPILILCLTATTTMAQKKSFGRGRAQAGCGQCGHCGGGPFGLNKMYEGRDLSFNCGCNGSYKHPVPPLSTYHWPGMFSHQLMTDYHSPWRFPPLKRYTDENPTAEEAFQLRPVRQASGRALAPIPSSSELKMSERMKLIFR